MRVEFTHVKTGITHIQHHVDNISFDPVYEDPVEHYLGTTIRYLNATFDPPLPKGMPGVWDMRVEHHRTVTTARIEVDYEGSAITVYHGGAHYMRKSVDTEPGDRWWT